MSTAPKPDLWVGNWRYVSGPRFECWVCYGRGEYQHPHNGDWNECSCVKREWFETAGSTVRTARIRFSYDDLGRPTEETP